jgi:hypothetical protein
VYDIIQMLDYALISRVPAVHAYDIIHAYDSAYIGRSNTVHAYDVVSQFDAATRSGNVTLSVTDILSIPEWFFRVNKALKIFEGYIPYELATASAIPAIYADDLFIIYDLGASVNVVKVVSVFDKLITDGISYTKSYSPLFFTLSRRKTPIRYLTLPVSDGFGISDYASVKKIIIVSAGDSVTADSASAKGVVAVPVSDYGLLTDAYDLRNRAIAVYDIIPVIDYGTAVKAKVLEALDYISVADNVDSKKAVVITALERLVADGTSYTKSYSPLFFSLLRRKVPIVYKTLSVLDVVAVKDGASVVPIKVVSVLDVVPVADRVDVKNIAISVSDYVMYDSAVPVRYAVLSVFDIISLPDSVSVVARKVVSASDLIMYDYVPNMSPSSIRYRSLYANVGMRTISVLDRITPYESVWVGPRVVTVNARDYLVSDGAIIIKRSVHAYDVVVVWENVNIVRL